MQRFFGSLGNRLILTHILVATAVLVVVSVALLATVPPLQRGLAFRRLSGSRQTSLLLSRHSAKFAPNDNTPAHPLLLQMLQDQARTQDVRILLVNPQNQQIVFDTANNLTSTNWPESLAAEAPRLRWWPQLSGNKQATAAQTGRNQIIRGSTRLAGGLWFYVAGPFFERAPDDLFIVLMRQRTSLWRAFGTLTEEVPPWIIASVLLAILAIIYLLSAWVAGSVTRNLAPMITGTQQIASGNVDYRVPAQASSLREVALLAASFNRMAERVQQSQQAQRDFVANVSHDLKTPLTSIQGFAQALVDGAATHPAAQARAAEIIYAEAQRLDKLVNQLLEAMNLDSGQLQLNQQPLDLNQNLGDLLSGYAARSESSGITLKWQPSATPLIVNADLNYLQRVFTNLLDNAFIHTPRGGSITIHTQRITAPDKSATFAEITLADTGKGIPAADLPHIFDRFYQVDKSRSGKRGFGLGLSIVRGIVEAHNGTVGVESVENLGSRFWVRLPLRLTVD
jgi:two-component system OmpR family sensor kinase